MLYCSRSKYALRQRHSLLVGPRRMNVQASISSNAAPTGTTRGGTRGAHQGRGGRGMAIRAAEVQCLFTLYCFITHC